MALHVTQCPSCESTFNTSARMLEAAHGLVRCGACLSVFEANENYINSLPPASNDELGSTEDNSVFISGQEDYFNPATFLQRSELLDDYEDHQPDEATSAELADDESTVSEDSDVDGIWTITDLTVEQWDSEIEGDYVYDETEFGRPDEDTFIELPEPEIPNVELSDTEVTDVELADTEVTDVELADTEVTDGELADTEVTDVELADTEVADVELADTEVADGELADTEVTDGELADTEVTDGELADTEVADGELADTEVTDVELADTEVTDGELADTEVTDVELADTEVADVELADTEVTDGELADTEVTDGELADTEVTDGELADTEVTDGELADTEVTDIELADTEVTDGELADTEVADVELADTEVADVELQNAEVSDQELSDAEFSDIGISDTSLSDAELLEVEHSDTEQSSVDFQDMELSDAELTDIEIAVVNLIDADLVDVEQHEGSDVISAAEKSEVDHTLSQREYEPDKLQQGVDLTTFPLPIDGEREFEPEETLDSQTYDPSTDSENDANNDHYLNPLYDDLAFVPDDTIRDDAFRDDAIRDDTIHDDTFRDDTNRLTNETEANLDENNNTVDLDSSETGEPAPETKEEFRARLESSELQDHNSEFESLSRENLAAISSVDSSLELEQARPMGQIKRTLGVTLLSLLLLFTLAGQFFWVRMPILSLDSELRPGYEFACRLLNCELPPIQNLIKIQTENLVIRSHPEYENSLVLTAVFRNIADYQQPFPIVELSFSDLDSQPVASREFYPSEYLAPELRAITNMPVGAPVQISVELVDPGETAVNYHLNYKPFPRSF